MAHGAVNKGVGFFTSCLTFIQIKAFSLLSPNSQYGSSDHYFVLWICHLIYMYYMSSTDIRVLNQELIMYSI